jgi:hypothetical protein
MTNMWLGVKVSELCDQHLLGLHNEIHKEAGAIENHQHGKSIARGHWKLGQLSTDKLQKRHKEVVKEMEKRGMNHNSVFKFRDKVGFHSWMIGLPLHKIQKTVLASRCADCKV